MTTIAMVTACDTAALRKVYTKKKRVMATHRAVRKNSNVPRAEAENVKKKNRK